MSTPVYPVMRVLARGELGGNGGITPVPSPRATTAGPPRSVTAPDVAALYASYRGQLARVQAMAANAQAVRARLSAHQAAGGLDAAPAWITEIPGASAVSLADADRELGLVLGELGKHAALVAGVDAKRLVVRASASTPGDLDIVNPSGGNVGELGFWPLLIAGAAILGRVVIAGCVTAVVLRTYDHLEYRSNAQLLEQGKDISKLLPPSDFGTKVSKVTTPLALAAGAIGVAMLVKAWRAK